MKNLTKRCTCGSFQVSRLSCKCRALFYVRKLSNCMHSYIKVIQKQSLFQASRGWLWHFCQRHRIRQLSLQGEKISANVSAVSKRFANLKPRLFSPLMTLLQMILHVQGVCTVILYLETHASCIQHFHLSGNATVPSMTDKRGSTVLYICTAVEHT